MLAADRVCEWHYFSRSVVERYAFWRLRNRRRKQTLARQMPQNGAFSYDGRSCDAWTRFERACCRCAVRIAHWAASGTHSKRRSPFKTVAFGCTAHRSHVQLLIPRASWRFGKFDFIAACRQRLQGKAASLRAGKQSAMFLFFKKFNFFGSWNRISDCWTSP